MRPRREAWLLGALCAAIGWFYVWTVRSSGDPWDFGHEQNDYFNLLIDGWLEGQLHLKVEVPEELRQHPDPYDPRLRRPGLGLHDASYYQGKYYLYFGAAPVVALMLPFRWITGSDLPLAVAVLVFVYAGFLASAVLWLAVRRCYFPRTGPVVALLGVALLGLAGLGPVLLRRPHMWELPIGAGYCFAMLALLGLWASLHHARGRAVWFAGAGLMLGLAIASRPTYLLASPLLAMPLLWWWRRERRLPWRVALAAVVPLALVGSAMAWHNHARFGDPLQFGQAYQFSLDYESKVTHFSVRYAPFNLWRYFWSPAQWSAYFPFIQPAELPPKPAGFSGHDDVYGVLRNLPIGWLALLAPLALWRRDPPERGALVAWLASVAVLFFIMAGVLVVFFGSLARYQSDFTPSLMLLACVGVAAVERWLHATASVGVQRAIRAFWVAAAVVSLVFAILFSLQLDGLLAHRNPVKEREVAQRLNRIPALFERIRGVQHGALEMTVRLPSRAAGEQDLLTVGEAAGSPRVFVRYGEEGRVQFGFVQGSAPAILSRPVEVEAGRVQSLRVALGALYPPETHPLFARWDPAAVADVRRRVRIELNGETLLDEQRRFGEQVGRLRLGAAAARGDERRFEGDLAAVKRVATGIPSAATERGAGFARLRLAFPERPATPREPLAVVGDAAEGVLIYVHYFDDTGRLALGCVAPGERAVDSAPVQVDLSRAHELVLRWRPAADPMRRHLEFRLDGTLLLARDVRWPEREGTLVAGRNVIGEPRCAPLFTGRLHSVQRSPDGRDPLAGAGGTLRLRVQLPRGRAGAQEPLVVTGRNGAGDILLIEYLDDQSVRFALDHWGSPLVASEPVRLDFGRPLDLEIRLGSLVAPEAGVPARPERPGRVGVAVNGAWVWDREAWFYAADPQELAIGSNPIGGTTGGPRFSGDVLAAERVAP